MTKLTERRENHRQWRALAAKFRAMCRASGTRCHLCILRGDWENAAIDYDAKPLSPNAFEADHFYPRNTHPHLAYSLENLRASHSRCNRQRRDEEIKQTAPQQVWVKPDW
jgi:5-methylcytosine-specific restriction endonuclease McrA